MAYRLSSNRQPGIKTANERNTKKNLLKKKTKAEIAADNFIKKFLAEVNKIDKPKKKPEVKTRKDSVMYSGQSKGYPNTLDIRYAKDLALQNKLKKKN
jgi:hypothetical protein